MQHDRVGDEERVTLSSYTLVDLTGDFALASVSHALEPVSLTLRIANLFDREYQPSFGFDAPGRTVFIGARATLGGN